MIDQPDNLEPIRRLLYTHQQMADALGIGETQLSELVREGCPRIEMGKRCVRYHPHTVLQWLAQRKMAGERQAPADLVAREGGPLAPASE